MKDLPVNFGYIPSYTKCGKDGFHILADSIKDCAIYMIDPDGLIKTWNKGANYIKGYDADKIIGKHISIFYTKKDVKNGVIGRNLKKAKDHGSFESEGWRVRKDGTLFWANTIFTALYYHQQLTGYAIITKNILDHKEFKDEPALLAGEKNRQSNEKLRHSELRMRQAQAIAHLGRWEIDFSTGMSVWAEETLRIYGLPPEDSQQSYESWITFIHPGDIDQVLQIIKEGESTLNNFAFFHRIIRKDGVVRYLYSQAHFELDPDGKPLGLYGVAHDITDMRIAEELHKESEIISKELLVFNQKLIDASPLGISSYNALTGQCLSANVASARITGATHEELLKQNFRKIESWKASGLLQDAEDTLMSGKDHHNKVHFITTFGNEVWIDYRLIKFLNNGQPHLLLLMNDITERNQAEDALKRSELRYRQIVETAHEGIWLIDENNITTFVNKKMCEILEYSQEEMLGKENYYFMDDAGKQEALKAIKRRKEGIVESFEVRYMMKSGKEIVANISANPIFDEMGNYKGSLAMVSNITEKRKLQDLLNKSNSLARIGSWEIDVIRGTVFWSAITKEIREADPDFAPDLATGIHFFREGENRGVITQRVQECIEKGIPWDEELQIITQKGNLKWIRTIGEAEFKNGKCIRVYGSFQDIDTRKNAQIEVLKAYEEKNIILESIGDAFFAVDKNWMVTYWNKEAEKVWGQPKHEIIGKNLWEIFTGTASAEFYLNFHKAVEENKVQDFETFYEKLNTWFELSAYPSPNGLSVYFRDITDKKILQHQLLSEQMNKQREITKAVVNAQEKERAGIGQELHDNVNQLLATARLYLNHSFSQVDHASFVLKGREFIDTAIDELRKLSHALVGPTQDSTIGLIDSIKKLINDISAVRYVKISLLYSTFNEHKSEVELKMVIYRIIQEQLNNILKHAGASKIEIEIRKEMDCLSVSISDNGKGFDTSVNSKGIGIKNIKDRADVFNGIVQIDSSPGNGCKMKIIFRTN